MLDVSSFLSSVESFSRKVEEETDQLVSTLFADLSAKVIEGTPVDTGRSRGNWYPSKDAPSSAYDENYFDPTAAKAVDRAAVFSLGVKAGGIVWLSSSVPYIDKLENGSSRQAPLGMVSVSLASVSSKYGGVVV